MAAASFRGHSVAFTETSVWACSVFFPRELALLGTRGVWASGCISSCRICTRTLTAALFRIAQTRKPPTCPSVAPWMDRQQGISTKQTRAGATRRHGGAQSAYCSQSEKAQREPWPLGAAVAVRGSSVVMHAPPRRGLDNGGPLPVRHVVEVDCCTFRSVMP